MTGRDLCAVAVAAGTLAAAGCGGDDEGSKAPQGALNVYVSVPAHGPTAATGRAVAAGAASTS